MAFNREYLPLGYNDQNSWQQENNGYSDVPVHTNYGKISNALLQELADEATDISKNEEGDIIKIWLYSDGTNPSNSGSNSVKYWNKYFDKLRKLSMLEIKQH